MESISLTNEQMKRNELINFIEKFAKCYGKHEACELTENESTRIFFLLQELKELRSDVNYTKGEKDEN